MRSLAAAFFRSHAAEVPESLIDDIRRTDPLARTHLLTSLQQSRYKDELEIVRRLQTSVAMVQGEDDQLVNNEYVVSLGLRDLWRGAPQLIPHAGHAAQWENADAFNELVENFIEEAAS